MNYTALAKEIHETAKAKGFWDDPRDLDEMLMLALSELSEGLEEHRAGKPVMYFVHGKECELTEAQLLGSLTSMVSTCKHCNPKPEGLVGEIADCLIRCMDTLQHYVGEVGVTVEYARTHGMPIKVPTRASGNLFYIAKLLSLGSDMSGHVNTLNIARALVMCETMIEELGFNPERVMRTKMDFNNTRPYKHGKAY